MDRTALEKPALTREEEPEPAFEHVVSLTAPALLVVGALDLPHIVDRHEELSESLENAFSVTLEETAHLPSLERPDLFDPLLLEFLEAVAGRGDDEEQE
jgi:pimeloyl-ACP methyl ester carboxylesterase